MIQIPKQFHSLFWDVDVATLDAKEYPQYVIGRVLEYGNEEAVRWLQGIFSEAQIKNVVASERRLSPKTANFWATVYHIPTNTVVALRK